MTLPKDWKAYVMAVVAATVVTIAGNCSSSRIDVLEQRAHALEGSSAEQDRALRLMIATLARLEQKLDDIGSRMARVEKKIDEAPRGRGR
jgi:uncharacterized coiled-coil protein SlyX